MKNFLTIAIILMSSLCVAQSSGNQVYSKSNDYTISTTAKSKGVGILGDTVQVIEANILMNVLADSYLIIINVSQFADSLLECNNLINNRINSFISDLKPLGIETEKIHIDFLTQYPVYEYEVTKKRYSKTYNEIPAGTEVSKNLHIPIKDESMISQIMLVAAKYDIYDLVTVDYLIKNYEQINDTLRSKAISVINKKVTDFKKLGVITDSHYRIVAESIYATYPKDRYKTYKAYSNASYYTGSWRKSVDIKTQNKKETFYFDKLPYSDYDVVINSLNIRPTVQFSYCMKVKYVLKKTK